MNWNEINVSLIVVVGTLISAVGGFIIAIFTNNNLRLAVVNALINRVRGTSFATVGELKNHDTVLKLKQLIGLGQHSTEAIIQDPIRALLYREYMITICRVFLDSIENVLKTDYVNYTEQEIKGMFIEQMSWRRSEYNKRFYEHLLVINPDKNKATAVLNKLEKWRAVECDLINTNILSVIGSGRMTSIEHKIDTIFHQYALGIDILCKNGADSFERLNGELTDFLISKT
jgi:hypothetical protein